MRHDFFPLYTTQLLFFSWSQNWFYFDYPSRLNIDLIKLHEAFSGFYT